MTNYNDWHVGMDVVCVNAKTPARVTVPIGLTEGSVYKLRWVGPYKSYVDGEFIGVRLEGVDRGKDPTYGDYDPPFAAARFRPLVNDPLRLFRKIATDPDFKIAAPEGPTRGLPDDGGVERERVKEEV